MTTLLRRIAADEFARRLKVVCEQQDKSYAFFIGAGCSVSSGIPDSHRLVREIWLPRLQEFRAPACKDLDAWAKREFPGYDADNPGALYGSVMKELFLQAEERQREIETLCGGRFPGFGYATLAKLMTIEGGHFNIVLTTNFDDLMSDALYVFTQARPLVIHHESLASFIRPIRTRPLVVKLHGDYRLAPHNTSDETERLKDDIQSKIVSVLHDRGLIFMGYGGNDNSINRMLEAMSPEDLPHGVYWVSNSEPHGAILGWLEARNAIWIGLGDFDQMMFLIKNELALPDPDGKQFKEVFENYLNTYRSLSSTIAALPDSEPDAMALKEAVGRYEDEYATLLKRLREINPEVR